MVDLGGHARDVAQGLGGVAIGQFAHLRRDDVDHIDGRELLLQRAGLTFADAFDHKRIHGEHLGTGSKIQALIDARSDRHLLDDRIVTEVSNFNLIVARREIAQDVTPFMIRRRGARSALDRNRRTNQITVVIGVTDASGKELRPGRLTRHQKAACQATESAHYARSGEFEWAPWQSGS